VLFGFLLNVTDLLRDLLQGVFVVRVLNLEVWGVPSVFCWRSLFFGWLTLLPLR
jgi:hypothetical protein